MVARGELVAGRYRLQQSIDYGGLGRVYRAHDDRLDRDVAIKLVDGCDEGVEREARAAACLSHPGIVRVFDAGPGFVAMELVDGPSLQQVLTRRERLPLREALDVACQVADALDHAHRQGIVHGSVQPRNILLTPAGQAKLVDFGIARAATLSGTLSSDDILRSAAYLAPEQAGGQDTDPRTDVYGLGVVLFEMLTGRPPFQRAHLAELVDRRLAADAPPPSRFDPSLPPGADAAVLRALARDPDSRFAGASAFRAALAGLSRDLDEAPAPTVRIVRHPVEGSRSRAGDVEGGATGRSQPARSRVLALDRRLVLLVAVVALLVVLAIVLRGAGRQTQVPALTGKPISQVPAALQESGLTVGKVTTTPVDAGHAATVVHEQPSAGLTVGRGSAVDLVVGVAR